MAQFPSNAYVTIPALVNVAQAVFAAVPGASGGVDIASIHFNGPAAARIITFRTANGGATEYFHINLPSGSSDRWIIFDDDRPLRIARSAGLEVLTNNAAGPVELNIYFWQPGADGIAV
ncbi:MAG: hypothetical protein ACREQL_09350 [Candidatus Binatia bacterium]